MNSNDLNQFIDIFRNFNFFSFEKKLGIRCKVFQFWKYLHFNIFSFIRIFSTWRYLRFRVISVILGIWKNWHILPATGLKFWHKLSGWLEWPKSSKNNDCHLTNYTEFRLGFKTMILIIWNSNYSGNVCQNSRPEGKRSIGNCRKIG